jgi:hypothetical protein
VTRMYSGAPAGVPQAGGGTRTGAAR